MKPLSLVIITTVHHQLSKFAIEKSLETCGNNVEDVIVFSDKPIVDYGSFIPIRENFNYADYNYIMLKGLSPFIKTDFMLHIHPDGFAVNKEKWTDQYLKYDYIGAPWQDRAVGNGGFSLRSSKLIDALTDSDIIAHWIDAKKQYVNEDHVIWRYNQRFLFDKYKINFAPYELAKHFSQEIVPNTNNTLGFHGTWILPHFFEKEVVEDITKTYYDTNEAKKEVWIQFLNIVYKSNYETAFQFLEKMQDEKGVHLWG